MLICILMRALGALNWWVLVCSKINARTSCKNEKRKTATLILPWDFYYFLYFLNLLLDWHYNVSWQLWYYFYTIFTSALFYIAGDGKWRIPSFTSQPVGRHNIKWRTQRPEWRTGFLSSHVLGKIQCYRKETELGTGEAESIHLPFFSLPKGLS